MSQQYVRNPDVVEVQEVVSMDSSVSSSPVLDWDLALSLLGDKDSALEIIGMLAAELPQTRNLMERAYVEADWAALKDAVHKLHGGACYTGTPRLKEAAYDLENELRSGNTDVELLYRRLLDEISAFLEVYSSL